MNWKRRMGAGAELTPNAPLFGAKRDQF